MLLDILFPRFCIGCNKFGLYICKKCQSTIKIIQKDICPYCEGPSYLGKKHVNCNGDLDGVISIYYYSGFIKTFIKSVKYKLQYAVWEEMYPLIPLQRITKFKQLSGIFHESVVQTIPLHPIRQKERGFNQVEPFTQYIKNVFSVKNVDMLKRQRNTKQQATLRSKEEREENIKNAFKLKEGFNTYNTVFLLDDVYTTGNTCKEAAKVLKQQGTNYVFAITIARG